MGIYMPAVCRYGEQKMRNCESSWLFALLSSESDIATSGLQIAKD